MNSESGAVPHEGESGPWRVGRAPQGAGGVGRVVVACSARARGRLPWFPVSRVSPLGVLTGAKSPAGGISFVYPRHQPFEVG